MTRGAAVAVVGPGEPHDEKLLVAAEEIGAGLAAAGVVVVTGGLDGVMAAASRGAKSAGGLVVGVLPGGDAESANDWVDVAVPTGLGQGRNLLVVRSARVVVAVGGSWGTLAEIALAMRLGVPVITYRPWQLTGPPAGDRPREAASPGEAVALALQLLQ